MKNHEWAVNNKAGASVQPNQLTYNTSTVHRVEINYTHSVNKKIKIF